MTKALFELNWLIIKIIDNEIGAGNEMAVYYYPISVEWYDSLGYTLIQIIQYGDNFILGSV